MPRPAGRLPAVRWRGKVYVGAELAPGPYGESYHQDAINKAFASLGDVGRLKAIEAIAEERETMDFGYAYADGSDYESTQQQEARRVMYFDPP